MNFFNQNFKLFIFLTISTIIAFIFIFLDTQPQDPKLSKPIPEKEPLDHQNIYDSLSIALERPLDTLGLFIEPLKTISSPNTSPKTNSSKSSPFVFYEDFEVDNNFSQAIKLQNSTAYGFKVVDSLSFIGKRSARFELRHGDPINSNGTRSEAIVIKPSKENEKWYSFAIYLPSKEYPFDPSNEVISQWHQGGSPAISLRIQKDEFYLRLPATAPDKKWINISLGKAQKDQWTEFVLHVIHSGTDHGLIQVWKNGEKLITYQGPNNYDHMRLPVWKIGIYKAIWNNNETPSSKRVVFFDDIKVGDASMNYEKMSNWSSRNQLSRGTQ
jgi:hypothetical protein